MIFLYTGRHAIRPLRLNPGFGLDMTGSQVFGSAEDLYQTLKAYKVKYVVQFPISNTGRDFTNLLAALEQKQPGSLQQVYSGKDKRFAIYEFTWRHAPGAR